MSKLSDIRHPLLNELVWFAKLAVLVGAVGFVCDIVFPRPPAVYLELYPSSDHYYMLAQDLADRQAVVHAQVGVLAQVVVPQRAVGFASPLTPSTQINIPMVNDPHSAPVGIVGPSAAPCFTGTWRPERRAFFDSSVWWNCGISASYAMVEKKGSP